MSEQIKCEWCEKMHDKEDMSESKQMANHDANLWCKECSSNWDDVTNGLEDMIGVGSKMFLKAQDEIESINKIMGDSMFAVTYVLGTKGMTKHIEVADIPPKYEVLSQKIAKAGGDVLSKLAESACEQLIEEEDRFKRGSMN